MRAELGHPPTFSETELYQAYANMVESDPELMATVGIDQKVPGIFNLDCALQQLGDGAEQALEVGDKGLCLLLADLSSKIDATTTAEAQIASDPEVPIDVQRMVASICAPLRDVQKRVEALVQARREREDRDQARVQHRLAVMNAAAATPPAGPKRAGRKAAARGAAGAAAAMRVPPAVGSDAVGVAAARGGAAVGSHAAKGAAAMRATPAVGSDAAKGAAGVAAAAAVTKGAAGAAAAKGAAGAAAASEPGQRALRRSSREVTRAARHVAEAVAGLGVDVPVAHDPWAAEVLRVQIDPRVRSKARVLSLLLPAVPALLSERSGVSDECLRVSLDKLGPLTDFRIAALELLSDVADSRAVAARLLYRLREEIRRRIQAALPGGVQFGDRQRRLMALWAPVKSLEERQKANAAERQTAGVRKAAARQAELEGTLSRQELLEVIIDCKADRPVDPTRAAAAMATLKEVKEARAAAVAEILTGGPPSRKKRS